MRIVVAGAGGVIGRELVPLLVAAGHTVLALTRSAGKAGMLRAMGAEPAVGDVFDVDWLVATVVGFRPDTVVHQLTSLPDDVRRLPEWAAANNRIRREGTANLLAAARAAGSVRILAQSVAWTLPGDSGAAVADLERMVLEVGGVVLRYGRFYGPGTYYEAEMPEPPRISVREAAERTVAALGAPSGVYVVAEPLAGPAEPAGAGDSPA
ncbi:MAG: NAD(P)H-binding protein [Actinomycetia bacterium]|nr:NAD(P)H-binding protein [Actinomycetes bacterium]